jgi:hypothetical protein
MMGVITLWIEHPILDEITEVRFFFLTNRRFERAAQARS